LSFSPVKKSIRCGRPAGGNAAGLCRPRGVAIARPASLLCSGARNFSGSSASGEVVPSNCTIRWNIRLNARSTCGAALPGLRFFR